MNDVGSGPQPSVEEFLASHGGPFYELQLRLRLLHEHALYAGRRAVLFIALAWAIPLLLALPGSLPFDAAGGPSFLADPGAWAKFFVAIGAFILAEQQIEQGLQQTLRQLLQTPIIAPSSIPAAAAAVNRALRRRDSGVAEAVCLGLAAVAALVVFRHQYLVAEPSWAARASPSGNIITAAGWWSIVVSMPLFWFLALRGLWRHFVWSRLMRDLARLRLRLVSTHPDGKGGIGFIGDYPNAYITFVVGISCAVAAAVGGNLMHEAASITNITMLMAGWLILVLALFAFPLSAFSRPLLALKRATIARLGAQATLYHRVAERKLIGANIVADDPAEAQPGAEPGDPSKQFETTRKLSATLLNRAALLPVSAAALLPFAILASTRVPFKEVLSLVKKLLLL